VAASSVVELEPGRKGRCSVGVCLAPDMCSDLLGRDRVVTHVHCGRRIIAVDQLESYGGAPGLSNSLIPSPSSTGAMCRSISSISPYSRSCRPIVAEKTSRFLPPAGS
jgi:hypothetical protein